MPWIVVVLVALLLPPRAWAQRPATGQNVTGEIRSSGNGRDQLLYVTNRSDEAVAVTSVVLSDCKNVQGGCGAHLMRLEVEAGAEAMVYRVRPRYEDQESGFRWSFAWAGVRKRPAADPAAPPPAPAPAPDPPPVPPPATPPAPPPPPSDLPRPPDRVEPATVSTPELGPVDSIWVEPSAVTVHVGESVSLARALTIVARDAKKHAVPGVKIRIIVELGLPYAKVEAGAVVGLKPGTAVLLVGPPAPVGQEPKGASRVVVRVVP